MPRKPKVIDLIDHYELLLLFRGYVDQCIEECTYDNKVRPLPFGEWYEYEYKCHIESYTQTTDVVLRWETHSISGKTVNDPYQIRIPRGCLTESGGIVDIEEFRRLCQKFSKKMNRFMPTVLYRGKEAYSWTWD